MFGLTSRPTNPYDEVIAKATDEKQTEINWEIALTVWDKVNEDGEQGARNAVLALQKRLVHRSANVQLFALTLAGALVNNCGAQLHREISGKTFTQTLVRLIGDRNTHDTVKKLALSSIETWVKEHPNSTDFDLLLDTYESLKRQGHVFPSSAPSASSSSPSAARDEPGRRATDDELRREEEELQRALAESAALADPMRGFRRSSPPPGDYRKALPHEPQSSTAGPGESTFVPPSSSSEISGGGGERKVPKRVRALFDFDGQTAEELPLRRGEEVVVLEEVSPDWWRGESMASGRKGIFPTNYIEPLPDLPPAPSHLPSSPSPYSQQQPAAAAAATEEEIEAEIFAQAASIDRLLSLMHTLRRRGEDFADNEELTDLYNSSMRLRPKVVQLIRKYEQKQADLQGFSEKVAHAKATYEQMAGLPLSQSVRQAQQPYPQQNGYHPLQQPPPHVQQQQQQPPYAAAVSPQPQAQPHSQPHTFPGSPAPQQQQQQQPDPAQAQREYEEEQRREYERKYAEYERQLAEYNAQMAAIAQQQQQQGAPPPAQHAAADPSQPPQQHPHHTPAPSIDPAAANRADGSTPVPSAFPTHAQQPQTQLPLASSQQQQQQQQPQPVWNGEAWLWPAQHAVPPPAAAGVAVVSSPTPSAGQLPPPVPAGVAHAETHDQAPAQGYPLQAQPYGQPQPAVEHAGVGGIEGGMAALSVSPGPGQGGHGQGGQQHMQQAQAPQPVWNGTAWVWPGQQDQGQGQAAPAA
ncbi:hypothetical protein JCM8547_006689 [Rhodosporidiobolus lusitaniae]